MDTIVRYEFDNSSFIPRDYTGPRFVKLINAPVIPATGDMVHLLMEEFFTDAELLRNFEEKYEGTVFYGERLNTIIGKETTEVIIVLYEESVFKILFPRFFVQEQHSL